MKLLLCLAFCSLAFLVTNGKKIKIQIESEDLVNMFEGVMYSEVLQKFASQLFQRNSLKPNLSNPYHPEDELINGFNTDVDREIKSKSSSPKLVISTDSIEKQNSNFLNGNDVASGNDDDILTDAEDMKSINEFVEKHKKIMRMTTNSTRNSTSEHNEMKMKIANAVNNNNMSSEKDRRKSGGMRIFGDDKAYFKPIQRRFHIKGSNDTPTLL